jgi:hypothetical protein
MTDHYNPWPQLLLDLFGSREPAPPRTPQRPHQPALYGGANVRQVAETLGLPIHRVTAAVTDLKTPGW